MILRGAALLCVAVLVGCSKEQPKQEPVLPALGKQGLALSSWKSASLDPQDRLLLAHAMAKGQPDAMIMVATRFGSTPAVAAAIAALGGYVPVRFDAVGYLRVRLPMERVSEVSALPDVLMAHIDGSGQEELGADIEALLRDAADPGKDVLIGPPVSGRFPEAGQDLFALMADRAVEVFGKAMFGAAGDAGRVESINGASSGKRALAVAGYADADSLRAHFDLKIPLQETVMTWSSRGPAADGGAKPDLLARMPGSQLAAGTSAASSNAAEAAASLIAFARTQKLPLDARHISWALRMSARRLENYQSHEQGFGVIDVERAKDLLRQLQARQLDLPDILTRAPVKTYLARFLPEPGVGQGLYEREEWLVGQQETREITLIRQNGAALPLAYSLQWRGNDGTFATSEKEVVLPLNVPVALPVEVAPKQVGIHSAHLYLIDKASDLPVHAVMTTVVASEQFTAANGYTIQHRDQSLPGLRSKSYFLEVPPNVASLRVDLAVGAGQLDLELSTGGPSGGGFNLAPTTQLVTAGKPVVVLVPNPPPGVYELALLPFGLSTEFTRAPYQVPGGIEVAAAIRYVDTQLGEEPVESNARTLGMTNIYAPLQSSSVVAEVGAQRILEDVGGSTGMRAYIINVAEGSSSLRVTAASKDGKARPGIYLYDCTTATCQLWGRDVFSKSSQKSLVVPTPRAGLWKAVVDIGAAGAAFKYAEIMTNPGFGIAKAGGEDAARRTAARWNQQVSYQLSAPVPFGYDPVGVMDVIDPIMAADERDAPYGAWENGNEDASGDRSDRRLRPVRLATQVIPLVVPPTARN